MLGCWRRNTLVSIYKNKGDIQNYANSRWIKLMRHTMKLWETVIECRLRKETRVTKNQFGFILRRPTMEAIFPLRRVMQQYWMDQQDLHLIFIELEKAYDRVPRYICGNTQRTNGLGLHIFKLSKIYMKGYQLVCRHKMERQTIPPLQQVCIMVQP